MSRKHVLENANLKIKLKNISRERTGGSTEFLERKTISNFYSATIERQ